MHIMKTKDVIEYFGSQVAVARALKIGKSAVNQWGKTVPLLRAYQVEKITNGALKVDEEEDDKPSCAA